MELRVREKPHHEHKDSRENGGYGGTDFYSGGGGELCDCLYDEIMLKYLSDKYPGNSYLYNQFFGKGKKSAWDAWKAFPKWKAFPEVTKFTRLVIHMFLSILNLKNSNF